jgi:hypothetical protein
MVKIDELMIGDWILWKSDKPENAFPVQVTVEMFKHELSLWPELFDYLELKPEMLNSKSTGFSNNLFWLDESETKMLKYWSIDDSWELNMNFGHSQIIMDFKHVHKLQHALKLYNVEYELNIK